MRAVVVDVVWLFVVAVVVAVVAVVVAVVDAVDVVVDSVAAVIELLLMLLLMLLVKYGPPFFLSYCGYLLHTRAQEISLPRE